MKNWKCICSALALALVLALVPAHAAVVITLPKAGAHTAWVADAGGSVLAGPSAVDGTKAVLDTGEAKNDGEWTAVVEDTKTGNAAEMPVPAGESPRLTLKADDFDRIGLVTVFVSDKEGKAPTYAAVTLTDGAGESETVALRAADTGRAVFRNVASGDGSVRVQQGDASNQQTVTVRLPLDRETPALALMVDVSLPDAMATQDAAPTGGSGAPDADGAGEIEPIVSRRSVPGFLIALFILAFGGFLAYRYLRAQGVTAQSALARAGITLPEDEASVPAVTAEVAAPPDPTVCPFCGGAKPEFGPCPNCAVDASGLAPPPSGFTDAVGRQSLVAVSGPRAGEVFPIASTLTIGRDAGQDVPVVDDPSLSRRHAVLEMASGGLTIADQGSSNGTWVNGQRVQKQELRAGDEVRLGASTFRVEV